ncbi:hypothetical protein GLOIN_2v1783661 [Rhizophagus clarus]|uniref:RNase H type-1 domain-containing protein n=1 Tax=Rhizophagus clarus TaxID=94130 RepID=A0A8H3R5S5_9GLOM|nr:hypothetical protein GLOIN_2v1783661 [Rhizophagus clarus]
MVDSDSASPSLLCNSPALPSPVVLPPGSPYRAEAAAIYAALSITPDDFIVSIYTDSHAAVDGLRSCASSTYTNSHFYYKTTNFEL